MQWHIYNAFGTDHHIRKRTLRYTLSLMINPEDQKCSHNRNIPTLQYEDISNRQRLRQFRIA